MFGQEPGPEKSFVGPPGNNYLFNCFPIMLRFQGRFEPRGGGAPPRGGGEKAPDAGFTISACFFRKHRGHH